MDSEKMLDVFKEYCKLSPVERLTFALTALDEASEALNLNNEDINDLRIKVYDTMGTFY